MIRVAVIENESELQRYGHANVVNKLRKAVSSNINNELKFSSNFEAESEFIFNSFTSVNIGQLFGNVENGLMSFDGLFISTNAFSDLEILSLFRKNKELISNFIAAGKGIFVGYQKKLNIETHCFEPANKEELEKNIKRNTIDFLPEEYQYYMPEAYLEVDERVTDENGEETFNRKFQVKKSEDGKIQRTENYDDILLKYPIEVSSDEDICKKCLDNEFNRHVYKSYLQFKQVGSYKVLLQDHSKTKGISFYPLLARAIPKHNERIVISTIVLDWEYHEDLLRNIIEYITKGTPKIAFVTDKSVGKNKEFDFLVNSTKMAKLAHCVYDNAEVPPYRRGLHDIYCFAPSISNKTIRQFWNLVKNERRSIKMYHLSEDSTSKDLVMTHYSNYGLLESIITRSRLWFKQEYERIDSGLWGGFWNTYDTMLMFRSIGEDIKPYLTRIREAISKRQDKDNKSYSYDKVFGCTLGMITILLLFYSEDKNELLTIRENIMPWINSRLRDVSEYDKLTYWLTFKEFYQYSSVSKSSVEFVNGVINSEEFKNIESTLKTNIKRDKEYIQQLSEIDCCRWVKFIQLCGLGLEQEELLTTYLNELIGKRDIESKWVNVSRTGFVLLNLLTTFTKESLIKLNINQAVESSINYLIDSYNNDEGAWAENKTLGYNEFKPSSSATARSIYAISLYNNMFSFTTKDFISVVRNEAAVSNATSIINNALNSLTAASQSYLDAQNKLNTVQTELETEKYKRILSDEQVHAEQLKLEKERLKAADDLNAAENRRKKVRNTSILTIIFLCSIILELVIIIATNIKLVNELVTWIVTLITTMVSFGITLVLQTILQAKLYPTEIDKSGESSQEKRKSSKKPKDKNKEKRGKSK